MHAFGGMNKIANIFTDDIFKTFFNENYRILNEISLKFIPLGLICNASALVQVLAWQ